MRCSTFPPYYSHSLSLYLEILQFCNSCVFVTAVQLVTMRECGKYFSSGKMWMMWWNWCGYHFWLCEHMWLTFTIGYIHTAEHQVVVFFFWHYNLIFNMRYSKCRIICEQMTVMSVRKESYFLVIPAFLSIPNWLSSKGWKCPKNVP